MTNKILDQLKGDGSKTGSRHPVLFIGHGSPMNAIETNDFTRRLNALASKIERPRAILCVSAHWMTEGTWVTRMPRPKTIHDFYGFPQALFDVQYPAPGSPDIADLVRKTVVDPQVQADEEIWGLDHGTWSVLKHIYPQADIPVLQLSVYITQPGEYHFKLGEQLKQLREHGVLIVGSGNIVHNLRRIVWDTDAKPFDWAVEFDEWAKAKLLSGDHKALITDFAGTTAGRLSVPTPDHYYPLLTILGAADKAEQVSFEYEGIQNGSISMRAVGFGMKA